MVMQHNCRKPNRLVLVFCNYCCVITNQTRRNTLQVRMNNGEIIIK